MLEMMVGSGGADSGEAVFVTPGTYQWTVPAGVESVSIVGVGAGDTYGSSGGGGGGALVYKNGVSVTPGGTLSVTVGGQGTDSVVTGVLTASAADRLYKGVILAGDLGGDGGRGGNYAYDGRALGGGGGAAGRYDGPGGNGAQGSFNLVYSAANAYWYQIGTVGNGTYPDADETAYWQYYNSGSYSTALGGPYDSHRNGDTGRVIDVGGNSTLYTLWEVRGMEYSVTYFESAATGTAGQGRGGDTLQDGEGVGLMGSNLTPPDNGYGYGGGYNRPGGSGAVRIIWGEGRAFPSADAGREFSAIVEIY